MEIMERKTIAQKIKTVNENVFAFDFSESYFV